MSEREVILTIHDDRNSPENSARVVLSVKPAATADYFNEVRLRGTQDGLIWLAKRILEIAYSEGEFHTHLDRGAHGPIFDSSDDWWLTIDKTENLHCLDKSPARR